MRPRSLRSGPKVSQKRTVRLSQTIVPFGVGAIYDVFGESFAACDIVRWGSRGIPIKSLALRQQMSVKELRSAPSFDADPHGIPFVRFPSWLFCQRCRTLFRWSRNDERPDEPAICIGACSGKRQLVPMRFVVACKRGHLGDVPWHIWAHSGGKTGATRCDNKTLLFRRKKGAGSGLGSLEVVCKTCKTQRSLAGITASQSLVRLGIKCSGTQPWQLLADSSGCDEDSLVVQRGASNVYFADIVSALEIPAAEGLGAFDELRSRIEGVTAFAMLRDVISEDTDAFSLPMSKMLIDNIIKKISVTEADIRAVLANDENAEDSTDHITREWSALTTPQSKEIDSRSTFLTRHVSLLDSRSAENRWSTGVNALIDQVVLVTRLKEVRALRGFTRLDPTNEYLRPDLTRQNERAKIAWAPAIEVFGEGIFLAFNSIAIEQWEAKAAVKERVAKLQRNIALSRLGQSILKQRLGLVAISSRFIMLHTLAHLLIRELCFECGYSSAALRERLYVSDDVQERAGILIYTAAGDVEGTMGGLVRQGESPRLLSALSKALEAARWCSADPICRESDGQGYDDTNLAACHACGLLPETSCVTGNMLLDRTLVVDDGPLGFFEDPLVSIVRA